MTESEKTKQPKEKTILQVLQDHEKAGRIILVSNNHNPDFRSGRYYNRFTWHLNSFEKFPTNFNSGADKIRLFPEYYTEYIESNASENTSPSELLQRFKDQKDGRVSTFLYRGFNHLLENVRYEFPNLLLNYRKSLTSVERDRSELSIVHEILGKYEKALSSESSCLDLTENIVLTKEISDIIVKELIYLFKLRRHALDDSFEKPVSRFEQEESDIFHNSSIEQKMNNTSIDPASENMNENNLPEKQGNGIGGIEKESRQMINQHKLEGLEPFSWLGNTKQLLELFVTLEQKGWIKTPEFGMRSAHARAIARLFQQGEQTMIQYYKGELNENCTSSSQSGLFHRLAKIHFRFCY